MKLVRSNPAKPAFKTGSAPMKEIKNPNNDMDLQDIVRILTDVTKQNKDFAEGLNILTSKVDTIVKSIADVMKANQDFCNNVLQEVSAISEYINIQPEEQAKELVPGQNAEQNAPEEDSEVDTIEDAEAADEGVTVEDIMGMKKNELLALIADNEVPIDPAKYPKVGDLKKALIQYLEEQYDADNEDDTDDADDTEDEADEIPDEADDSIAEDVGEGDDTPEADDESDDDGSGGNAEAQPDDEEDDW